jgi:intracellular septation protein
MTATAATERKIHPALKLAIEIGPLVVFFLANARAESILRWSAFWAPVTFFMGKEPIYFATAVFMAAIAVSLAVSLALTRKLPVMPLVTAAVVLVFGGLTLYLQDDRFIKLKPTIVNMLFAASIFTGLALRRNFIRLVMGPVMQLDEEGWRKMAIRWGWFFVALAALNEVVWRTFSTDTWVAFKVFGIMPLTVLFSVAQVPLISRHMVEEKSEAAAEPESPAGGDVGA